MPAAPEVAEAGRPIWAAEVLRKDEAHQQGEADGDVGVAGEVAVDLGRVGVGGEDQVRPAERLGDAEGGVDDDPAEVVGDHHLLDQAEADQPEAGADGDVLRVTGARQLGDELAGADDRAGDQVGEEGEVDADVQQRGRLELAALDVDHVGDRLEGEEADPDRQRDREQRRRRRKAPGVEQIVDVLGEEAVVLEGGEGAKVEGHDRRRQPLATALALAAVDRDRPELVDDGDPGQQQAEARVGGGVEDVAGEQDERLPVPLPRHQRPADRQHDREEDRELDGREEQWLPLLVRLPGGRRPAEAVRC